MKVSKHISLIFFGLVLLNLAIGAYFFLGKEELPKDLLEPRQALRAVESLSPSSLYCTPAARTYLEANRPGLLIASPSAKPGASDIALQFAQGAQDPSHWRKLARQFLFDTALLTGEPGEYKPLLRHLLSSKDWTLTYVDHTSLVFRHHGEKTWLPEDLKPVTDQFTKVSTKAQAELWAQLSNKLLAVTQYAESKRCLEKALERNKKSPEVWTAKARYQLHFGQWAEALEGVNKALAINPNYLPALSTKAHVLFTLHRFREALPISERLVKESPTNPQVLLLHAKIAHEIEDFEVEAATLENIIRLAEQQQTSTTGYRLFLAQAYAHNGQAVPALQQFHRVLEAQDLTAEQRQNVLECINSIQTKIQPAAPAPVTSS